jgi:hypothetical protein
MANIKKTSITVLKQEGVVRLMKLERPDCSTPIYAVSFPPKLASDRGDWTQQFLNKEEAEYWFLRFARSRQVQESG